MIELYDNRIINLNPFIKNFSLKNLLTITFYGNPLNEKLKVERFASGKLKMFEFDQKGSK